jgi:catechol 2,3-dioxygenase-like lactoylglutathione lyase family enzyme
VQILALDHVNLRTARLDELVAFYVSVVGLSRGPRPPFAFGGAWLYAGERPIVHLVEVPPDEATAPGAGEPRLSHFALRASGLGELLARLDEAGVARQVTPLPGTDVTQVHFADPDGNALHLDFTDA